jgi:hypothetical protein
MQQDAKACSSCGMCPRALTIHMLLSAWAFRLRVQTEQEQIRGKIAMVLRGPRPPGPSVPYSVKVRHVQEVRCMHTHIRTCMHACIRCKMYAYLDAYLHTHMYVRGLSTCPMSTEIELIVKYTHALQVSCRLSRHICRALVCTFSFARRSNTNFRCFRENINFGDVGANFCDIRANCCDVCANLSV